MTKEELKRIEVEEKFNKMSERFKDRMADNPIRESIIYFLWCAALMGLSYYGMQ